MAIDRAARPMDEFLTEDETVGAVVIDLEVDGEPTITELDDGGVEIEFSDEDEEGSLRELEFDANLAEHMDEDEMMTISSELMELVEEDISARKDWVEAYVKGLDIVGFNIETRTEPWENACGVYSNLLAEAVIRFQAETMSETFPAAGPVKTKILGEETKEKTEASIRVAADMNYELTENMSEYRPEHEKLLYELGLAGSAFKKIYRDPDLGRQVAVGVSAEDVIVPYGESQVENAERVTHILRKSENDMKKAQRNGFYREVELSEPAPYTSDIEERKAKEEGYSLSTDSRYAIYELHIDTNFEGDDDEDDEDPVPKPYVVSIEKTSGTILSIRRNWLEDDPLHLKRQHFVHYVYVPGFGFYGLGLIHIIGGYALGATSIIRQLVDAGTLANLPGGLKARGMNIKNDDVPIGPGEWKDVDVVGGSIRESIMPLPYKEPSQTLLLLLDKITSEGRRLGAISDMNISDMSANAPVGTTLALLERTLKPMAAVQARVHYTMKQEFKLLKTLIAENAPMEYTYVPERGEVGAKQSDYALVSVIPVSDPNSSTMAQRVVQHQAVHQLSQSAPQIYNLPELHRQMIEVLGVKNADKIVPISSDIAPTDPVSENMNALVGKPIKAFITQDSDAHIAAHTAFMQDPMISQTIGQNPQGQQIMMALQAHIAEHLGFKYRKEIEDKLGVELPPPNKPLPEDIEVQLSRVIAEAGKQIAQQHMQQDAQKKAQEQAADPGFQLKQQEEARKTKKDQDDGAVKQGELARKQQKDKVDAMLEAKSLGIREKESTTTAKINTRNADNSLDLEIAKMAENRRNGDRQAAQQQRQQETKDKKDD